LTISVFEVIKALLTYLLTFLSIKAVFLDIESFCSVTCTWTWRQREKKICKSLQKKSQKVLSKTCSLPTPRLPRATTQRVKKKEQHNSTAVSSNNQQRSRVESLFFAKDDDDGGTWSQRSAQKGPLFPAIFPIERERERERERDNTRRRTRER